MVSVHAWQQPPVVKFLLLAVRAVASGFPLNLFPRDQRGD